MYFISVENLAGGVILEPITAFLTGFVSAQQLLTPGADVLAFVYEPNDNPGVTADVEVSVFPNPDGSGAPLLQPLEPDAFGRLPGYVAQPGVLDLVYAGSTISTRRVRVGVDHDRLDLLDAPTGPVGFGAQRATNAGDATAAMDLLNRRTGDGRYVQVAGTLPDVRGAGGVADAVQITDAVFTAGDNHVSSVSRAFTNADVGKCVMAPGIGAAVGGIPGPFVAYVASVAGGIAALTVTVGGAVANAAFSGTATATIGTPISAAITAAFAASHEVRIPEGSWVWDAEIDLAFMPHLSGAGEGRTKVFYPSTLNARLKGTGTGLTGAAAALTSNAVQNATFLACVPPAGLVEGDFVYVSSNDAYDAVLTVSKCGEFVRVGKVDAGANRIYLDAPIVSDQPYLVASGAQVQKVVFDAGFLVEGITWINATPEIMTSVDTTGVTQVATAGGGGAGIKAQYADRPIVRDCKELKWGGTGVTFTNCIHGRADNLDFKSGAQAITAGGFGYGVQFSGSMWCRASHCHGEATHALINRSGAGAAVGDLAMPTFYGDSIDCEVRNGYSEPFTCHNHVGYCRDFRPVVTGGSPQPPDGAHTTGINEQGHFCKAIDAYVANLPGTAITLGLGSEAIRPVIRNIRAFSGSGAGAVGIRILGIGLNARVVQPDIDGVAAGGSDGQGIRVEANATGFELAGQATIRNVGSDGVEILDTSNTESLGPLTVLTAGGYGINTAGTISGKWRGPIVALNCASGVTNLPAGMRLASGWQVAKRRGGGNLPASSAASNFVLFNSGTPTAVAGSGTAIAAFYLDPSNDFPSGSTSLFRLRAMAVSDGAPGCDLVFSLRPVATWAGGGGAGNPTVASVSGAVMTVTLTNAALLANTPVHGESTPIAPFAANWFVLCVTPSVAMSAASAVAVECELQVARA